MAQADTLVPVRIVATIELKSEGAWVHLDDAGALTFTTFPPNLTPEQAEIYADVPTIDIEISAPNDKQALLALIQQSLLIGQ